MCVLAMGFHKGFKPVCVFVYSSFGALTLQNLHIGDGGTTYGADSSPEKTFVKVWCTVFQLASSSFQVFQLGLDPNDLDTVLLGKP